MPSKKKKSLATQLRNAIAEDDPAKVLEILAQSPYSEVGITREVILEVDGRGASALHYAAQHGSLNIIPLLLDAGSDVNAPKSDGGTPFDMAQYWERKFTKDGKDSEAQNCYQAAQILLAYGAVYHFGSASPVQEAPLPSRVPLPFESQEIPPSSSSGSHVNSLEIGVGSAESLHLAPRALPAILDTEPEHA